MTLCPTCAPRGRCDNPQMCMAPEPGAVLITDDKDVALHLLQWLGEEVDPVVCGLPAKEGP